MFLNSQGISTKHTTNTSVMRKRDNPKVWQKAYLKQWRILNKDKYDSYNRLNRQKRRARERLAEGSFTKGEWETLKVQYGFTCNKCKRKEPDIKLTIDHIIPLSKGGSNYIENIQPLCGHCNYSKGSKLE